MQHYRTTAPTGVNAGATVQLSGDQANARQSALRATERKGVYTVKDRIEFKAGEIFGLDGDLPKSMAEAVEPPDGKKQDKAKK